MNLHEIKVAVKAGKTVCWKNSLYTVQRHGSKFDIVCSVNNHSIGLTWADGKTLNGRSSEFKIAKRKYSMER
jgi:hypothetical protein